MRRALRGLSSVMIVSGLLLLLDAGLTLVWEEPVSNLYSRLEQRRLGNELEDLERQPTLSQLQRRALSQLTTERRRVTFLARALQRSARPGQAIGRMRIPSIGAKLVLVQGTDAESLRRGPGHYPETPLPGARGTVGVAGHRTTYGAPFRKIDKLKRGDRITVEMPYARMSYRVERLRIVPPTEVSVVARRPYDRVVLTACHPLYSAAQRIVAYARLDGVEPLGSARVNAWPRVKRRGR